MKRMLFEGVETSLDGSFLKKDDLAPDFILVNKELETVTLENFKDKKKFIATLPSIDTPVCSQETKQLNEIAKSHPDVQFLVIARDLPFSQDRFCSEEHLDNIIFLSNMRTRSSFGKDWGVLISEGPLEGLLARSIIILNESDKVIYSELVEELTSLPNFEEAETSLREHITR